MNCIPSTVAQWCVNGRRILLLLLALGLGVIGAQSGAAAPGSFSATGSLATSRSSTKAVLLQSGKVLVPGGFSGLSTNPLQLPSAELYDPATGSWSMTGSLTTARSRHTVTLLPSGKVLVAGGRDSSGRLAGAEIYDAATGNWSTTGSLTIARAFHTATLIAGGKVLVTGSQGASNGEVYDPATGIWSMTSNLVTARYFHTATLLPNGKVLVAGGVDNSLNIATASAELYDPTTGNWSATGSLATARNRHTATLLPSGKVLVAGGYNDPSGLNLTSAELYDPATGSWSATGALATARQLHTATLLQNGLVLVAGGFDPITSTDFASAELYNPAAGSWSSTGSLMTARDFQAVALLPTGKVLFAGGTDSNATALASSELYGIGISYVPLLPARIWDSRVGPGPVGQSGPGSTRTIQVAGVGGVPATGASAVVINVGAINPTAQTFVTVWPTGEAQPLASNLNVPIGDVRPNLVIVKLGLNGQINVFNNAGNVDFAADIAGWYGETGTERFTSLSPARVWDTRSGPGPVGRIEAGGSRNVPVTGLGGVPATGVTAVVLNVAAVLPSAKTFITAWPAGESRPLAANLNIPAGDVRANLVVVKVGANGEISFFNNSGDTDLVADVAGYFGATGATFNIVSPSRIWDTRSGPGPTGRIAAGASKNVTVTGIGGVPATGVTAVVVNLAGIRPSARTFVTAWPAGETRPLAANLNIPANDVRPNLVVVKVGANGQVSFFNNAGDIDLVADIAGWYGAAGP